MNTKRKLYKKLCIILSLSLLMLVFCSVNTSAATTYAVEKNYAGDYSGSRAMLQTYINNLSQTIVVNGVTLRYSGFYTESSTVLYQYPYSSNYCYLYTWRFIYTD